MKKIIKTGTKKITECEACGCKFSYDYEDVDGNQHDGFWVTCPQCSHECPDSATAKTLYYGNKRETCFG